MRLTTLTTPLFALSALLFLGCPTTGKDDSGATETDADTDTDTDTDTDSDTDADTTHVTVSMSASLDDMSVSFPYSNTYFFEGELTGEAGAYTAIDGSLTYLTEYDGATVCDFDEDVTGETSPYEGDCPDCTFAMATTTTVTRDDGTTDCDPNVIYSFQGDDIVKNLFIAHTDLYEGYYYEYENAFMAGFSVDYSAYGYGYYEGPYFNILAYDGNPYGAFTQTDNTVQWDFAASGYDQDFGDYYYYCYGGYTYQTYGVYAGTEGTGSLDCDGLVIDTWTFEGVEGGTAYVTVDTVATETAFDPHMWVNDPEGCSVGYADDSFDCTYPPPTYQCPGVIVEDLTEGTYEVVVNSYGDCAGTTSDYSLQVDITTPI